jgi:hypothetical protein
VGAHNHPLSQFALSCHPPQSKDAYELFFLMYFKLRLLKNELGIGQILPMIVHDEHNH